MFCMSCGRQLPDDARFCDSCGATVTQSPAPKQLSKPNSPPQPSVTGQAPDTGDSPLISGQLWEQISSELLDTVLEGMKTGLISLRESKKFAQYILDHQNEVQTYFSLNVFLLKLRHRWKICESVCHKHTYPDKLTHKQKMELVALDLVEPLNVISEQSSKGDG